MAIIAKVSQFFNSDSEEEGKEVVSSAFAIFFLCLWGAVWYYEGGFWGGFLVAGTATAFMAILAIIAMIRSS